MQGDLQAARVELAQLKDQQSPQGPLRSRLQETSSRLQTLQKEHDRKIQQLEREKAEKIREAKDAQQELSTLRARIGAKESEDAVRINSIHQLHEEVAALKDKLKSRERDEQKSRAKITDAAEAKSQVLRDLEQTRKELTNLKEDSANRRAHSVAEENRSRRILEEAKLRVQALEEELQDARESADASEARARQMEIRLEEIQDSQEEASSRREEDRVRELAVTRELRETLTALEERYEKIKGQYTESQEGLRDLRREHSEAKAKVSGLELQKQEEEARADGAEKEAAALQDLLDSLQSRHEETTVREGEVHARELKLQEQVCLLYTSPSPRDS